MRDCNKEYFCRLTATDFLVYLNEKKTKLCFNKPLLKIPLSRIKFSEWVIERNHSAGLKKTKSVSSQSSMFTFKMVVV